MFRKFGRLVSEENLQEIVRAGMFYIKPSQERKEREKNRNKKRRRHN